MNPLESVENLARIARRETPPETNLNFASLLRELRPEPQMRLRPWAWSAAVSALAASIVLAVAIHGSSSTGSTNPNSVDSITPLFNAAQVQMP
jgi:hypothetical protein